MDCLLIMMTSSLVMLKGLTYGEMMITTPENFFVPSTPLAINCTSSVPVNNHIIQCRVDGNPVVTMRYSSSTGQCFYVLPNETIPSECKNNCECDLNGRSTLYKYNYGGQNSSLTLQCLASVNDSGSLFSPPLTIEKSRGPAFIGLSPSIYNLTVNETGQLGPIICTADCLPNCTFQWTGPETNINSGVLEISDITKSQNGTFTCTALNRFGRNTVGVDVFVQYAPQNISLEPSNQTHIIEEGKTLGPIYCTASCSPSCIIVWTGQGVTTKSDNLTITNISKDKTGTFTCVCSNVVSRQEKVISVTVQFGPESMTINPIHDVITVNETDRLGPINCTAKCLPHCTFQWTGPTTAIDNGLLMINSTTKSHNGTYTCTATNMYGKASVKVDVIVQYGPQNVLLEPSNQTYIIEKGKTLGPIYCIALCNPSCTAVWTGLGVTTTSDNLTITNLSRNKTGTFTCIASNVVSRQKKDINVTVHFGPENLIIYPTKDIVKVNETDTLGPVTCLVDCLPMCTIHWIGPGMIVSNESFLISSTSKSDNGTYKCTAKNQYGNSSDKIDVIVQYGPTNMTLSTSNRTLILLEYETLNINCSANCNPGCNYSWSGSVEHPSGNLHVLNIQRNHSGNFTCKAGNIAGTLTKTVGIIVHYAAKVTLMTISNLSEQTDYAIENETLDFLCKADGLPKPHIKWLYTNTTGHTKMISPNENHIISRASCIHIGDYTCEVSNGISPTVNRTMFVNITCPPTIREECSTQQTSVVKRNQTKFIVACLQSNPEPNIEWTKLQGNDPYNTTIMESVILPNSSLIYSSVVKTILLNEEEMYLFITAYNTFGNLSAVPFYVEIADKPFEPRKVSVQCEEKNTIQWYPNSDGGSDQTFDIEFIENNQTKKSTGQKIVDEGTHIKHSYTFTNLKPSTYYTFFVVATNELGSTVSTDVSCITARPLTSEGNYAAIIAGGTVAGCVSLVVAVVVIVFIKRRHSQGSSEKDKGLIKRDTNNDHEEDEDGLKDNPIYVSNDTAAVIYSQVNKAEVKDKSVTGESDNTKYAKTVKKEKKDRSKSMEMGCVYENTEGIFNIQEGPEYGNVGGKSANSKTNYIPKKNKDGLIYADLVLSSAAGGFVIRGLENKSIYADIDLTKSAEPLPSDSDNDETSAQKDD